MLSMLSVLNVPCENRTHNWGLGVKSTHYFESSKFSVVHIFHVIWTFLRVAVHLKPFFPSNIVLFLPVQLAGY